MIEHSPIAWLLFGFLLLVATLAGRSVASWMPWSEEAARAWVPQAVSLALGPFLAGLSMLFALIVLAGRPGWWQALMAMAVLGIIAACARRPSHASQVPMRTTPSGLGILVWRFLLAGSIVVMLASAIFLPLTQNDALEYMIAAREVFLARTISAYPPLSSEANASGFFGPWTHPPLYVALLDLVACLQGHFREPGLTRLVAPWAASAALVLTTAVGSMGNKLCGLMAGCLLAATPIFLLGADSALSDALPVLGMTLLLACVAGLDASPGRLGGWVGLGMGLCLYGHSMAVLCLPLGSVLLAARFGFSGTGSAIRALLAAWLTALAVGVWPYVRNVMLFGAPISDEPLVFALQSLCWSDYFETGRGIGDWPGIIQYGWFKGWTAIESLGIAWWIALGGIVGGWRYRYSLSEWAREGTQRLRPGIRVPVLAAIGLVAFIAIVVTSTVLGMNLLIKNERYFLIIQPLAALIAGSCAASAALERESPPRWTRLRWGAAYVLAAVLAIGFAAMAVFRFSQNGLLDGGFGRSFEETLGIRNEYRAMRYVREQTPPDSLILSTKPADMFYADRRMVSYLDPRLAAFYASSDAAEAADILHSLGITHLHAIDYGLPAFTNSQAQQIARDPKLSELLFQADGVQIFALVGRPRDAVDTIDLLRPDWTWTRTDRVIVGGRKSVGGSTPWERPWDPTEESRTSLPLGLFNRDYAASLTVGRIQAIPVPPETLHALDVRVSGHGHVRLWIEMTHDGRPVRGLNLKSGSKVLLGEAFLGRCRNDVQLSRLIRTLDTANRIAVTIEHLGNSSVRVLEARLTQFGPDGRDIDL